MEEMQFLVEAYIGIGFGRFRLQNDETWREIPSPLSKNSPQFNPDDAYTEQDKLFEKIEDTQPYIEQNGIIRLGGSDYEINDRGNSLEDMADQVFMHAKVKRMMKPRHFVQSELRGVIASGDDTSDNRLILTLDGYFELLDPKEQTKLSPIAVRYETFCADNGYVGLKAAGDSKFIQETYLGMLEGWRTHLMNNKLDVYIDYCQRNKPEKELWKEIEMLTRHLKKE